MTAIELPFPSSANVNFPIRGLSGAVRYDEMISQAVFHSPGFVHAMHVHGVIHGGGGMVDDDLLPSGGRLDCVEGLEHG